MKLDTLARCLCEDFSTERGVRLVFFPEVANIITEIVDKHHDPEEGICKLYLGFTPLVILSRAESAEAILTDNQNLTKPMVYTFMDKYIPNSLLTS